MNDENTYSAPDIDQPHASEKQANVTTPAHNPLRFFCGGAMMGLANLVPGISGGTMLVATGVYDTFIESIAEVTRFKFKFATLKSLAMIVVPAILTILCLAGLISYLMQHQRALMYSLFIGLTMGGVPIIIKLMKKAPIPWTSYLGGVFGIGCMVLLAVIENTYGAAAKPQEGFLLFLLAGIAGASAMILPGISGGYLLLLMGAYLPILNAIKSIFTNLKAMDFKGVMTPVVQVALPVGLGVVIGVVVVSNVIGFFFRKYKQTTLGFLAGLLLGSLIGLWPFQSPQALNKGDLIKGRAIVLKEDTWHYEVSGKIVKPKDIPHFNRLPQGGIEIAGSLAFIVLGFGISQLASRFDKETPEEGRDAS